MESMGNLNHKFVRTVSKFIIRNPRVGAYTKFLGDARKLKNLDIKESYIEYLRKSFCSLTT